MILPGLPLARRLIDIAIDTPLKLEAEARRAFEEDPAACVEALVLLAMQLGMALSKGTPNRKALTRLLDKAFAAAAHPRPHNVNNFPRKK